jgi:hypothetical protein
MFELKLKAQVHRERVRDEGGDLLGIQIFMARARFAIRFNANHNQIRSVPMKNLVKRILVVLLIFAGCLQLNALAFRTPCTVIECPVHQDPCLRLTFHYSGCP